MQLSFTVKIPMDSVTNILYSNIMQFRAHKNILFTIHIKATKTAIVIKSE